MKVAHLTSIHARYDTRIFVKQCCSLANAGYDVYFVVADDLEDECKNNVKIVNVGKLKGRMNRVLKTTNKVFEKALSIDADIYQIHDPEMLPIALKLKKLGKKVIYDAHEDVPVQIFSKEYINKFLRLIISKAYYLYENWALRKLDGVLTATAFIKNKLIKINPNTIDVNNFPLLSEYSFEAINWKEKKDRACYMGYITKVRGALELTEAMQYTNQGVKLSLGGSFNSPELKNQCQNLDGWKNVDELGWLSRRQVQEVYDWSKVGLVTLHPISNYIDCMPVKMFEYMAAGIPVISSDFEVFKNIVVGEKCGVCVDPLKPKEIAEAINYLIDNPSVAEKMGSNGRKAVLEKYNWGFEEKKLLDFYKLLLNST
ncbi:MAG: glycosyltransferase [Alphaproteobacteria bacterium]|nr:glycosyltransferase [Alphaproteobacteria bacterium]